MLTQRQRLGGVAVPFGRLHADAVVVATGVDANQLLGALGCPLPIEPEMRHLFLSEPVPERLLEPLVVAPELHFATKQLGTAASLRAISRRSAIQRRAHRAGEPPVREGIRSLVPVLEYVDFTVLASGPTT